MRVTLRIEQESQHRMVDELDRHSQQLRMSLPIKTLPDEPQRGTSHELQHSLRLVYDVTRLMFAVQ